MWINGTLLVQALNFIVFYFVLRKLFLKPAVDVLIEERKYIKDIEKNIETFSKEIYLEQKKQDDIIKNCRQEAKSYSPNIFISIKSIFSDIYNKKIDTNLDLNKKEIVRELKKAILGKNHVS